MVLFGSGTRNTPGNHRIRDRRKNGISRLHGLAALSLTLAASLPPSLYAQASALPVQAQAPVTANPTSQDPALKEATLKDLPGAPIPAYTTPLYMRSTAYDFTKPRSAWRNPIAPYLPISVPRASFANSVRLGELVQNGKIYLSLSDAIALALENNLDIAIARYNLDIADTDILRARAGSSILGVNSGVVENTIGGTSQTLTSGGGPGGTSGGSAGAASGSSGITLTTAGAGPTPEVLDPTVTGAIELQRQRTAGTSSLSPTTDTNTNQYNFSYTQGFLTGTQLSVNFDNTRTASGLSYSSYSPLYDASLNVQLTQHLLQGFGTYQNRRYIIEAINNRHITDSAFRQQILYTVNQVEQIYWALVTSYEDLQAKERALEQSSKLTDDNRKQLAIGTLAPLDVVNSDSAVAADKQALISSQTNLEYQQLVMKQAIARNLNDPSLVSAPIIPTDRISLEELSEEKEPAEQLVQEAFAQRPELEQAVLTLKNDEITLKGAKNALLPTVDAYAFYGAVGVAGSQNANAICGLTSQGLELCPAGTVAGSTIGAAYRNLFNSSSPDKGIGFNLSIPLRNRTAQSVQARSQLEYRQAQLHLQQLYTQIRMQVVNAQFSLTNDRAAVLAAQAARDYANRSLEAEDKKLRLGASTTASVLQQQRNLATAENTLISDNAAYAKDRAALYQIVASTLSHYGISLNDAVTGNVQKAPIIPGLEPPKDTKEPKMPGQPQ